MVRFVCLQINQNAIELLMSSETNEETKQLYRIGGNLTTRTGPQGGQLELAKLALTIRLENFDLIHRDCNEIVGFPQNYAALQTAADTQVGTEQTANQRLFFRALAADVRHLQRQMRILEAMMEAREAPEVEAAAGLGALKIRSEIIRRINFADTPAERVRVLESIHEAAQRAVIQGVGAHVVQASRMGERALLHILTENLRLEAESLQRRRAQIEVAQQVQYDAAVARLLVAQQAEITAVQGLFAAVRSPLPADEQRALYETAQQTQTVVSLEYHQAQEVLRIITAPPAAAAAQQQLLEQQLETRAVARRSFFTMAPSKSVKKESKEEDRQLIH